MKIDLRECRFGDKLKTRDGELRVYIRQWTPLLHETLGADQITWLHCHEGQFYVDGFTGRDIVEILSSELSNQEVMNSVSHIMTVTEEMNLAGHKIASDLVSANVAKCMGGLGGAKSWEEFESLYLNSENLDLIRQYVEGEIDSVTAIYLAMARQNQKSRMVPVTK